MATRPEAKMGRVTSTIWGMPPTRAFRRHETLGSEAQTYALKGKTMLKALTKRFVRPRHQQPNTKIVSLEIVLSDHMLRDIGLPR